MKQLPILVVFISLALSGAAQAKLYDFTYDLSSVSSTISHATGVIDVENGIAVSGYLDVTVGPNLGIYNLVSLTSPLINGDSFDNGFGQTGQTIADVSNGSVNFSYDDVVNVGSDPLLTVDGLAFQNVEYGEGFDLWEQNGSFSLFDAAPYEEFDGGTLTLTVDPAPEPLSVALSIGACGLLIGLRLRRLSKEEAAKKASSAAKP